MFGFSYDSQFEAFNEDLEFNTKGFARPFSYYMGLIGMPPVTYDGLRNQPEEQNIDEFKTTSRV